MAQWFSLPILGSEPQELTDDYLLLPRSQVTGIKLREGDLQVKSLCREPSPLMITDQISGWAAGWVKWSLSLTANSVRNLYKDNPTTRVHKRRWLRKLSLESDQATEVNDSVRIEQGCRLELATLHVNDAVWWSLALESFGPPQTTDESLRRCIHHFLRRQDLPIRLLAADSKSYSDWLASFATRTATADAIFRAGVASSEPDGEPGNGGGNGGEAGSGGGSGTNGGPGPNGGGPGPNGGSGTVGMPRPGSMGAALNVPGRRGGGSRGGLGGTGEGSAAR